MRYQKLIKLKQLGLPLHQTTKTIYILFEKFLIRGIILKNVEKHTFKNPMKEFEFATLNCQCIRLASIFSGLK